MDINNSDDAENSPLNPGLGFKGKNISEDVLKIEISGPNRPYFSITDVPGVFHTCVGTLTEAEREQVKEMVFGYMKGRRTIIMYIHILRISTLAFANLLSAVATGTSEIAGQLAFQMASKEGVDPKRERTVGVITKCDVTQDVNLVRLPWLHER